MLSSILLAVSVMLQGVTGNSLRARAFFDANNVKVGDPLVLTLDFLGDADFKDIHPPALSRLVNRRDWKVDDASAKTETFRDWRRLTYRVRPLHEGVLYFPSIEFACSGPNGEVKTVSNEIPVHAKPARQVKVAEMDDGPSGMPQPPAIVTKVAATLTDDEMFAWRRACALTSAVAFAEFDWPEARLNEATCDLRDGKWADAMKIYTRLEWTIGQTPAIEQGMLAALALQYDNPDVALPMWRQVLRPILRFAWLGRVSIVVGGFLAVALVFWLLGRGIRAVACVTLVAGWIGAAGAQGIFQQFEQMHKRMQQQMQQAFGGGSFFSFGGEQERHEAPRISATLTTSKPVLHVGEPFEFLIAIEVPKTASIGQIRLNPSEDFGLTFTGQPENLKDMKSSNPTNVIRRLSVPARYDVPYNGKLSFTLRGMVSSNESRGRGFSFSFSNSFTVQTRPIDVRVKPLENAPADYGGVVSEGLRLHEYCDILSVETNDVVTITYKMVAKGYVPADYLPKGMAFEVNRQTLPSGETEIAYRRYFVANGETKTPAVSVSYYDPRTKSFRTATVRGTGLKYHPTVEE